MRGPRPSPHPDRDHTLIPLEPGASPALCLLGRSPRRVRSLVQSAPFLGSWDLGVAALSADPELSSPQGQAVLGSPSHRPPSASGSPCCLGKLTAAQRPPSASGLGQSTARPPPPFVRGLVTQIFPPSSQHQPHACGAFSRVARKAGPATSGTLLRPPPGEDSVEEDSGSVPPTRRGQPPAPPSRLPAARPGRCSPAPTLVRLRKAGLGLAGPGWARLMENPDRWGCLSPPGSRTHTHSHTLTLRIGGPSRRWCGSSPGDSSAHACDVKARPLFTQHQH